MRSTREAIWRKYDGRCAYCGTVITIASMQIDHHLPLQRGVPDPHGVRARARDTNDNQLPSCARCNRWKATMALEEFRGEIAQQVTRLRRDSAGFRLAEDYGLVASIDTPIVFYFERTLPTNDY